MQRACSTRTAVRDAWESVFTVGFIEQAFTRVTVEESLRHGEENEQYQLREDVRLREQGMKGIKKEKASGPRMSVAAAVLEAQAAEDSSAS